MNHCLRFPVLALLLCVLGCGGSRFRPVVASRLDAPEAHIDVVEAKTFVVGWASNEIWGRIQLRTFMPAGTRLGKIMLVNPRLKACTSAGLVATSIQLDDEPVDAGLLTDVSGEHRVSAVFGNAGNALLHGPVALDWYDEVDGEARCGRIALVDSKPEHAWTNATRWSFGIGASGVVAVQPVGQVRSLWGLPARFRYSLNDASAVALTVGAFGLSVCRSDVCETTSKGGQKGGFSLPLGVGYDRTLLHSRSFAIGLGARYAPQLTAVPLLTGMKWTVLHELAVVPRVAIVEPRRWPSGLPGSSHGASIDLELPVGVWVGDRMRDASLVLGGVLMFNTAL